jgi:hypothetical protein
MKNKEPILMIKSLLATITLASFLLLFPHASHAMRCGNDLVDVGDTKIDVLKKCGEPTLREEVGEDTSFESDALGRRKEKRYVEQWTYNFGSTRLIYVLTIKSGKVVDITTLDKGF